MLHRIETTKLELGMYIASLEGSWLENPFWRSSFLLSTPEQLETLVCSYVVWVTIDDTKGKGLPKPAKPKQESKSKKNSILPAVSEAVHNRTVVNPMPIQDYKPLSRRERNAEVKKASAVLKRSRTAVMSLFEDARLGNAVKAEKMAPLVDKISQSVDIDPTIILNMSRIKKKDEYTYLHSVAVCALMINFARKLRIPEDQIHDIGMAGLLHDVGKTAISDNVLMKPGKLDAEEWTEVKTHPHRGAEILEKSKGVSDVVLDVCLGHHEKMDGTGYPGKVEADCLSLVTRMSSICDVYDAITSQRPYNEPLSASQALAKMGSWTGHFDKLIFRDFVNCLGILPVGTLVRLSEGDLAMVIGESPTDFSAPLVRTFHSLDSDKAIKPQDIDTSSDKTQDVMAIEDPETWGFSDWSTVSTALMATKVV
jgi:cyclic di-GMP phosphodiesterase